MLPIFLVVKWGQSSPWRFNNSTWAVAVVIYGWQCAEVKLQLSQRQLDLRASSPIYRTTCFPGTLRQRPCWGHLDSHGCLWQDLAIAMGAPPTDDMSAKSDREQNVACLVDKLPPSTAVMLRVLRVCCFLPPLPVNTLPSRHSWVGMGWGWS